MSFEFEHLGDLGDEVPVEIPLDDLGYLGRECPEEDCLGHFKVKPGTGLTGDDLDCHCPYCGHVASSQHFWTQDQIEYAKSVALQLISEAIQEDLKKLEFEHKPRGAFGIGISLKVEPGAPIPLHRYAEPRLETYVTCDHCSLDYAVYGVFAYCPDCGKHNSLQILANNLDLVRKQVTLAGELGDAELRRHLLEDALENCVSAFDGFGREAIASWLKAQPQLDETPVSFQNLTGAATRLKTLFSLDFQAACDPADWERARVGFLRRHVLAHRAGVVDQRYIDESGDQDAVVGRRLVVDASSVETLATSVSALGGVLVALLAPGGS